MDEGPRFLLAVGWGLPVPHNVHFSLGLLVTWKLYPAVSNLKTERASAH